MAETRDAPTPAPTHATEVVVWNVPTAVECGAPLRIQVGVKCASGCAAAWRIEVRDSAGHTLASAIVGQAPSPGTTALYAAELALLAPTTSGLHGFEAHVAGIEPAADRAAHAAASARFELRAVPQPEHRLTVVAVDALSQAPVAGARVVVHPYRAVTDASGRAVIRVPAGSYSLFVSGRSYFPFRSAGHVDTDVTIRAELDADLAPSDAEIWS